MILLPPPQLRDRLLANGRQRDVDHVPVVKFFNPVGASTWLAAELDEDGDTLFGLADLGFGCPEFGSFSLSEITSAAAVRIGDRTRSLFRGRVSALGLRRSGTQGWPHRSRRSLPQRHGRRVVRVEVS